VAARLAHRDPRHRGVGLRAAASSPATANRRTTLLAAKGQLAHGTATVRQPRLGGMTAGYAGIERDLEKLRRDGSVVAARFDTADDAGAWRADIRRACRAAGLRIRTGLANADDRIAWVYHVDHVVTEAAERAARRALEAAYGDQPHLLFHQLAREEQRKMLRIVGPGGQ
jgi:hypothetical protein